MNLVDPLGLAWYNPISWNWNRIQSGIKVKGGIGLGLDAKLKIGPLQAKTGAKYALGVGTDLLPSSLNGFINGEANLLSLSYAHHEFGLGLSYDLEFGSCMDGHLPYKETILPLVVYENRLAQWQSSDWTTVGGSVHFLAVTVGASIDLREVLLGILQ
jgi:hypothetical protein